MYLHIHPARSFSARRFSVPDKLERALNRLFCRSQLSEKVERRAFTCQNFLNLPRLLLSEQSTGFVYRYNRHHLTAVYLRPRDLLRKYGFTDKIEVARQKEVHHLRHLVQHSWAGIESSIAKKDEATRFPVFTE
jgi:hypothetical protein